MISNKRDEIAESHANWKAFESFYSRHEWKHNANGPSYKTWMLLILGSFKFVFKARLNFSALMEGLTWLSIY